ncbi:hypothetical protein [Arthrobacter sp. efr-133-TYG-120]|uniref:hypothetical protein n=1 Tax=Arthrobacter sp. efr-133-TYG-120 TaxID=3040280 RepID=UPI00254C765C|nr:hypothetical protein [Arthrobacter sp. efr-133-TYG-120]
MPKSRGNRPRTRRTSPHERIPTLHTRLPRPVVHAGTRYVRRRLGNDLERRLADGSPGIDRISAVLSVAAAAVGALR